MATKVMTAKSRDIDIPRLCRAMKHGRWALERFRQNRKEFVREYVGNRWSEEGPGRPVYLNLIELFARTIGRNLIAKSPRVMLSTFDRGSKPTVKAMEDWVNKEIERGQVERHLSRVVFDALFSIGVAKVALARPSDAAAAGWNLKAGEPFVERVDLDDFVYDPQARDLREAGFVGHRTRVPYFSVKESSIYSRKERDRLTPSVPQSYNQEGDERLHVLGRGYHGFSWEEFEDMVDLWEIYLPRERLVLTLAADAGGVPYDDREPLLVQEWLGPDCGPYHFLGFGTVPDNAMPVAPVQNLYDLHLAVNEIYRKLIRQAQRQKEMTFVMGGATEDGTRVMQANDGDILRVDNPEKIAQVSHGSPNQANFLLGEHLKQLFDMLGGNLSIVGGLAPQSKTASQDKMLNENSSRSVADLQDTTVRFVAAALSGLCWYWWHDPFRTMKSVYALPGHPEVTLPRQVTPQMRQRVRWADLDLRVDPYSLQHQTPQSRMGMLDQVVTQVVIPLAGALQQQGIMLDMNAYLTKKAALMDMPDLGEIVTIAEPPQPEGGGGGAGGPSAPANTTREYVRRSLGGDGAGARENQLQTTLARGMGQQQASGPMSPGGMQ